MGDSTRYGGVFYHIRVRQTRSGDALDNLLVQVPLTATGTSK